MATYRADARSETMPGRGAAEPRSLLFLQGPISNFFDRLGRALNARGHQVHRINLHLGDQLFWRLPATHYRGRFEDWRAFVGAELERHQVTDLVLHGDRRPYHIVAAEEARARGIAVIATDLGYVRPDWITLEYDGMTTYSRFPRDPEAIRALAGEFPEPDLRPRFRAPFWLIAVLDIAYNLGLVFGRFLYPHYRYHSVVHPFAEYAGWLWSRSRRLFTARAAAAEKRRLAASPGSYFLVPLQLLTDYQIRAHSPFRDVREAVREIVASFAACGSLRKLVFVEHPLDNGLIGWHRLIKRLARQHSVTGRILVLPGGTPTELLCNAAGIVTVNSTIGVTALQHGMPVKLLGNAVFDVPGLTSQAPLQSFWHSQPRPDPALVGAFLRALIGATQVKGGYYRRDSQDCALAGFVERLEAGIHPLPPLEAAELAARAPRPHGRSVVIAGVSTGLGTALARAEAAPGVRLCLVGDAVRRLARVAADCRQRGAVVEILCVNNDEEAALADGLIAFDRARPVDTVLVYANPEALPGEVGVGDAIVAGPLAPVAALIAAMRQRGRGEIVLVSGLAGRPAAADRPEAQRATEALLGYADLLRRRLRADGLSLTIVVPSGAALRAAAWLRAPELAAVGSDRLAARIAAASRRQQAVFAVPRLPAVLQRAPRMIPRRLRESGRALLPPASAKEAPLPGETGTGD